MSEPFVQLIADVYRGDAEAIARLVDEYEPEVRRIVRFKLRDPQLRRIIDSTDICQSVFANFFCRAALGQFELESKGDLINLLAKMAANRVIDQHRTEQSQRRLLKSQSERLQFGDGGQRIASSPLPDNEAEYRELLERLKEHLSGDELEISRLRVEGKSWLDISQQLGASPQALRKRLERACDRAFEELGIRES